MHSADYLSPHWPQSALLLIDVQNDFISGSAIVAGTAERVAAMARLASAFRAAQRPIVHLVRLYPPGDSDIDSVRRAAVESGARVAAPGSAGAQIPAALLTKPVELDSTTLLSGHIQTVGPDETILYKPRWSAFHRTQLDSHLQALGVNTVVVAGCNLPNCPRATLFDASERDYRTVLATDATSQTTRERLDDLTLIGTTLLDADQVAQLIASPQSAIRVSAGVIVDAQHRVLLVRKRGTTAFMQPGGKIDPGESAVEALQRELAEELNLTVAAPDIHALGRHIAAAANEPDHLVDAELFAVTTDQHPRAGAEIDEIAWIDPHNPGNREIAPLTEQAVFGVLRS